MRAGPSLESHRIPTWALWLVVLTCSGRAMAATDNPFANAPGYVDPSSNARRQADSWRHSRPAEAALLDKIAAQPAADWFGDWNRDVRAEVDARVNTIDAAGALPILVAYNIPLRDLHSYSAGGAASADAYRLWIRGFAQGIGDRRAVVILEPDALSHAKQMAPADRQARLALMREAVQTLAQCRHAAVYIDIGHAGWLSPEEAAALLKEAGVASVRGFALNVSNFVPTDENIRYGHLVSRLLGGKTFIVDTSRNGRGPASDGQVVNPPGRALGHPPTSETGDSLVDAFVWAKKPGESDGTANGGPQAGAWWPEYALDLARGAAW